jgi:hypothetical protein
MSYDAPFHTIKSRKYSSPKYGYLHIFGKSDKLYIQQLVLLSIKPLYPWTQTEGFEMRKEIEVKW